MEELIHKLEKLSKVYSDTPEDEEKILIPYIKSVLELPMKERRKLLPIVRDLQWIKHKSGDFIISTTLCDPAQLCFLSAVQFVCANKREMEMAHYLRFDLLCKLLLLYCPTWLADFVNNDKIWYCFNLNYDEYMTLVDMGYLKEMSPSRIAQLFPSLIRIRSKERGGNDTFDSNLLLKRDITLKEHIWTIFEYESSVIYEDDCAKNAYKKGITERDERISTALYRFSLDGHLDRNRLLKATLAAFHRNFKKDLTGWFAGLFETLQPDSEELLSLQEEMMQVFTSPYTKPVNVMLQQLKKIVSEADFRYREFTERAATLFFSGPKNLLLNIYAIFEQVVSLHPEMKETYCITLCQLFLKKDESLQKKAVNFILKYGDGSSSLLQETLQTYQSEMLQSVQGMLAAFLPPEGLPFAEEAETVTGDTLPGEESSSGASRICREDNRISLPANKEDFLFQLSRLFDMEESWEVDTTIASILAFHPQLDKEDFSRMEPVFQRAANIVAGSWEVYKNLLATFLLEYERLWAQADTSSTGTLRKLFTKPEEKLKGIDSNRGDYDKRSFRRLADWQPSYSSATCFQPLQQLWLEVIRKIEKRDTLPLLSTPTHSPAYLQATELVKRLAAYRKANANPCPWDFQLAIARCAPEDKEEAVATARQLLTDEYLRLCLFLLDENTLPQPPYNHQSAWVAAGLVKNADTEFEAFKSFSCTTLPHNYLAGNYGWSEPKHKEMPYSSNSRLLDIDFRKWHEYVEHNSHTLWQEHLIINSDYSIGDSLYMERLFSCFPNRPEPLIAQIIGCYMDFDSPQEDNKRTLACALRMLLSFHCPLREMSLLLLGGSLLFVDKTVRSYAAELWVEVLTAGRIDNHRLGEILARLVSMDIAPLKRFITQVYESMYKRSVFHDRRLEELLTVCMGGLSEKPVTGQKQLLELYLELLHINHSKVTDKRLLQRLNEWTAVSNLKKAVTSILQLS